MQSSLPQAPPLLLQWASLSLVCLVPPLTEDYNHAKGRKLLLCRILAAITWLCLMMGLGFKHRLVAQAKGPGGVRSVCGWETPRDDRALNALGTCGDFLIQNGCRILELLSQPLAHDCVLTFFEVLQDW